VLTHAMVMAAVAAASLLAATPAAAHPLGNFTINHYTGVRIEPDRVLLDHVIDMAEIPAFQERRTMIDTDGDGAISPVEEAAYRDAACGRQALGLDLVVGGDPASLHLVSAALGFPPGAGGLVTLRLTCEFEAALANAISGPTSASFTDGTYPDRIGWREIVIAGDGTTVQSSGDPTASVSARLTAYPKDLLSQPLDVRGIQAVVVPGGPPLAPLEVPELQPAGGAPNQQVPGGVTELVPELAAVLQAPELSPSIILLAFLVAAGLGAYHALTPGHGKTVMAAYLVGTRGRVSHAIGLAATVAISHTLGVLSLAVLVFVAQSTLPPDRLIPWLSVASGAIFLVLGASLVRARVLELRRGAREVDPAHGHAHPHPHAHPHLDPRGQMQAHARPIQPAEGDLTWRNLLALGFSGGLVPAPSALLVFLGSITLGRPVYGFALVLAFGLGMAAVLAAIGLVIVRARSSLTGRFEAMAHGRLTTVAQLAGGLVVLVVGLVVTVQASVRVL
jgi:nickel/cobalt exporter